MKKIFIAITIMLAGCNDTIDGAYTCSYENEFYKINDTLVLKKMANDIYHIDRKTGVNQKLRKEAWTLEYDKEKQVLTERKKGKIVVVLGGGLIVGNRTYKKIKL